MRRWTDDEIDYVATWITRWRRSTIAARLGRSERSVKAMQERRGIWATTQDAMTARAYALETGQSPQWVSEQCRRGRLPARRVPGGRTWLIRVEHVTTKHDSV